MIAVTFALAAESSDFADLLDEPVVRNQGGIEITCGRIHARSVALFHTGVGAKSCRPRIEKLLQWHQFRYLISTGFAGALKDELRIGDLLLSENFSNADLIRSSQFGADAGAVVRGNLATIPAIVDSISERARLAAETGAAAVDMETQVIAAACAAHQIPMLSLRVISDTPSRPLPAPPNVLFDLERQTTSFSRLALYLATHPQRIKGLIAFRQQIALARASLTGALDRLLRADLI